MGRETALGMALKSAVETMSKKKQTEMIAEYIYGKYDVFKRFNLDNRFQGEVSEEERLHALEQPGIREAIEKQDARRAEAQAKKQAQADAESAEQ